MSLSLVFSLAALTQTAMSVKCVANLDVVQVQDMTMGFGPWLSSMKANKGEFLTDLQLCFPNTKVGFATFTDKPLPYVGYGWGDYKSYLKKDYCYEQTLQLTGDKEKVIDVINAMKNPVGGNDVPENQFEALINAALDPTFEWTPDVSEDELTMRVAVLVTDAHAHGFNNGGQKRSDGVTWPSIIDMTGGWDLWYKTEFHTYSWGYEYEAMQPDNVPYSTWRFPLLNQLSGSAECHGDVGLDYVNIGRKISQSEKLSDEEKSKWEKIKVSCGPSDIYAYLGLSGGDELAELTHPGTFTSPEDCTKFEYPNQNQLAAVYNQEKIKLVVVVPDIKGDNSTTMVPWFKWAYGCTAETNMDCVAEYYRFVLEEGGVEDYDVITTTPDFLDMWDTIMRDVLNVNACDVDANQHAHMAFGHDKPASKEDIAAINAKQELTDDNIMKLTNEDFPKEGLMLSKGPFEEEKPSKGPAKTLREKIAEVNEDEQ